MPFCAYTSVLLAVLIKNHNHPFITDGCDCVPDCFHQVSQNFLFHFITVQCRLRSHCQLGFQNVLSDSLLPNQARNHEAR